MNSPKPYRSPPRSVFNVLGITREKEELAGDPERPVWMHPIEFAQVVAALWAVAPKRMLEWGAGGSSSAWLSTLPSLECLVSIEHNAAWGAKVREDITDPRFTLVVQPPLETAPEPVIVPGSKESRLRHSAWSEKCEVDRSIMGAYVDAADGHGAAFDAVLVDGRARVFCLQKAVHLTRPGGLIILHDAQRQEYKKAVQALGAHRFLEPFVQGQVCLLRVAE